MKRSLKSTDNKSRDLFVFEQLKLGLRPSQICSKFLINKKTLQHSLSSLKAQGSVKKVGYGVWEICDEKEVSQSTQVATHRLMKIETSLKQDSVRGHGFVFRFELPKNLRNWEKRADLLQQAGVPFKPLRVFGGGQSLIFKNRKVWLTDQSIIIYEKESFISDLASESQSKALSHFLGLLRGLERHLKANFEINRSRFKVSRQHYALMKNALAKQYDDEGKKLECYTGEGLWFLIDNSFNLNEAETVHPKTAVTDNKKVQDFFNGLKQVEGFTPQFVTNSLGQIGQYTIQTNQNLDQYAIHLKSHVESVQLLGKAVTELTQIVKEIKHG